jgi:hypothetical protein
VDKGTGKYSKSGHRGNEGWQSKPSRSCQPEEPAKKRNKNGHMERHTKAYKIRVLGLSETWLKKGKELVIPGYTWTGVAGEKASGKVEE